MKRISLIAAAAAILLAGCTQKQEQGQWSPEKAQAWYDGQGWLAGCDYIPADASFLVGIVEPVVVELMMQGGLKSDI